MLNLINETVNGYEILELLGKGGQANVFKAHDIEKDRIVAVKVIRPEAIADPAAIKRFQMEATIAFFLRHPYVVSLYDYWRDERGAWMVMRWFQGGSLRELTKDQPLSLEHTSHMLDRIASALAQAHLIKVVHRDIKPDNILFDEYGNAYLTDFGAAKRMELPALTQTGLVVGSPSYFSPEHIQNKEMTPRTDVYSLGIVLFETLTARHPFGDLSTLEMLVSQLRDPLPDIRSIRPDLTLEIDDVIQRATQKDPDDRYQDVRELARDFRQAIGLE
jgi:eukaryotic-like serine/threonine-protein kinase